MSTDQSPDTYPAGSVRRLLPTALVHPATRQALEQRLHSEATPTWLDAAAFRTLQAATQRLMAGDRLAIAIDPAVALDQQLADNRGDGWRYATLPEDQLTHQLGLQGLDQSAQALFGMPFAELAEADQDRVLQAVQHGTAPGEVWQRLSASGYFEELLVATAEAFYSHPLAQEEIGYVGMADTRGWEAIGLNEHEPWEPHPDTSYHVPGMLPQQPDPAVPPTLFGLPMRHYAEEEWVDAVVIGTGAGGAPVLARLAQAGLTVVALEAGPAWQPHRDFATDERAQQKLFWLDERVSAGSDPLIFGSNNSGTGVGGSTLHYTAYVPRPQPDDFQLASDFGVGRDWPLSYAELEPYYTEVERILGVSGPSPYPWGPPRVPYPLPPLPLNGAAQLMQRGCQQLGIHTSPAANAALSAPYFQPTIGWRARCTNRGFCQAGCSVGAKGSMDVTFIPLAVQAGAEVRAECFATSFEYDPAERITAVLYQHAGQERRQRCRSVWLCAGAVETPRLLLINGLATGSGQVGRNLLAHPGLQLWAQFPELVRPFKGIPGALISEDTHRPADADFAGGYLLQSVGVMPVTYASQLARARGLGLWGPALRKHMRGYNHVGGIDVLGECLPYDHNYLELSDEHDGRGLPKPRSHFSAGANERQLTAHAERTMRAIWEAAGGQGLWTFRRYAHVLGTCRMGPEASSAVVDRDGCSFEVPNLLIADASIFPSALSVNPALTIMALALRCADQFLARARHSEV